MNSARCDDYWQLRNRAQSLRTENRNIGSLASDWFPVGSALLQKSGWRLATSQCGKACLTGADPNLLRRLSLRVPRHSLDKLFDLTERQAFPHWGAASRSRRALRYFCSKAEQHSRETHKSQA